MTGAFYVICGKESIQAQSDERKENHGRKAEVQIQADLDIELVAPNTRKKYPKRLRMVVFYDEKKIYTWNCSPTTLLGASTIAKLYKRRWSIEAFFKDIKTHLKIKTFVGTSFNAVMIQIWSKRKWLGLALVETRKRF